jgi:hypothetical protein
LADPSKTESEEPLLAEKLKSLDRPSVVIAGMVVAHSLKISPAAVLMVDVLGRVVAMPPGSVKILTHPRISDAELDEMEEREALDIMVREERTEEEMMAYLRKREG